MQFIDLSDLQFLGGALRMANLKPSVLPYEMRVTYNTSSRAQQDKGKENVLIAVFMIENQGQERGSMICEKSNKLQ